MMKIKISYEKPQELDKVLKLMKPIIKSWKVPSNDKGRFKKAYIDIKE